jgi:hypothetical protein
MLGQKNFLLGGGIESWMNTHETLMNRSSAERINNSMHRSWQKATIRFVRVEP